MNKNDILAIVVSFNGGQKTEKTVRALLGKIDHIHIIDNGSEQLSIMTLRSLETHPDITITYLPINMGIGFALNIGVSEAKTRGYAWILTMDQDSLIDREMIHAYCQTINDYPDLASLAPVVILPGEKKTDQVSRQINYAITSGNLIRVDILQKCGLYDETMFIDALDIDFSLRVRLCGWRIWRVGGAFLYHELGDPHKVPKPFSRFYTLHPPIRRYYMYRNFIYLIKKVYG